MALLLLQSINRLYLLNYAAHILLVHLLQTIQFFVEVAIKIDIEQGLDVSLDKMHYLLLIDNLLTVS